MGMFKVIGLLHPGKVNLFRFGTVNLCLLPDEKLLEIYRADPKIPYLQPTAEGLAVLYPNKKIEVKPIDQEATVAVKKQTTKKKTK